MRYLYLMRHAKSAWNRPALTDRDRGLNPRGRRDAPRMGRALAERLKPMRVNVSAAFRARMTLAGLCEGWPALATKNHQIEEPLYTFSAADLADWISGYEDAEPTLFVISHNPALTDLVNDLGGRHLLDNIPTAGYVELSLHIDRWRDLVHGCAQLDCALFPKQLAGE